MDLDRSIYVNVDALTSVGRNWSPIARTMFLDVRDKDDVLLRSPWTLLDANFITTRRPAHGLTERQYLHSLIWRSVDIWTFQIVRWTCEWLYIHNIWWWLKRKEAFFFFFTVHLPCWVSCLFINSRNLQTKVRRGVLMSCPFSCFWLTCQTCSSPKVRT